jgi:hypothetical protein
MVTREPENSCLNPKSMLGFGPVSAEAACRGEKTSRRSDQTKILLNFINMVKSLSLEEPKQDLSVLYNHDMAWNRLAVQRFHWKNSPIVPISFSIALYGG